MIRIDNLVAFLILLVGLTSLVEAARDKRTDPYLVSPPGLRPDEDTVRAPKDLGERIFSLRHIYHHGSHEFPNLHRYVDVPEDAELVATDDIGTKQHWLNKFPARAVSTNIQRMVDRRRSTIDNLINHAAIYGEPKSLPSSAWTVDEIAGPNTTDKKTIITFAQMAANSYYEDTSDPEWKNVKGGFNWTDSFGWESDGLRGHIFATPNNDTIVIGMKGTSMAVFDGAETTGNDKLNDNLFGSCCCAQGEHVMWKQVCDCKGSSGYSCNNTCLVKSLQEKNHYYKAALELYGNVTDRYPNSEVWLSGHSLGGVVSALLGLTHGVPVMTYEAYPDALAAKRLGLPTPPGYRIGSHQSRADVAIHHFGHTADPIFMGTCNAASSLCTLAGYALEGQCHTGKVCTYDTVNDRGWRVGVGYHKIVYVISDVLESYDGVANCTEYPDCTDCYKWKFFESNGTETTTSKSSTSIRTRTRTETCKTPGWWGCLDESTTTSGATTTTSTSSSSTSTCKTPGWFGCKDPITTTSSSTTSTSTPASPAPTVTTTTVTTTSYPSSSSSSSCADPGWFGCNDPTSTTSSTHLPSSTASNSNPSSHTCTSKAWFGLICLDPSPTSSTSKPSSSNLPTTKRKYCLSRGWGGFCKEWSLEPIDEKSDL